MDELLTTDFDLDPAPEPVRFEVSGHDPDGAMRDLSGVYGARQWLARRTADEFSYRYTAVGDSDVTIRRSQLRGLLRGSVPVGADYVVQWISSGTAVLDVLGEAIEVPLDRPTLFPPDREFVFVASDYDQRLVHLDRAFVHGVAAEQFDLGERALRFDHLAVPDEVAQRTWRDALSTLSRALRDGGIDSVVWDDAKRATVSAFLRMYPPQLDPLPPELSLPKNARLRAAVEYVHAHAQESVTVADLAQAAGLSVRSVQESFRRVFDVAPLTYLREVRLDRVREALLEADPQSTTVGDVARTWQFAHLGRFSGAYAERFGEYPKQTLRR